MPQFGEQFVLNYIRALHHQFALSGIHFCGLYGDGLDNRIMLAIATCNSFFALPRDIPPRTVEVLQEARLYLAELGF